MILLLSNGKQIRGDLIKSAVLRSDLVPIPLTLEANIRVDESLLPLLAEGQSISLASGDRLRIIKSVRESGRAVEGIRELAGIHLVALLEACHEVAFVRNRAIIKENARLSEVYRAAGASLKAIEADFSVPRFCCPAGETPTFHIARALQEEGGVVRWKSGRMHFVRLPDLFTQKPAFNLPDNASDHQDSGFLERHEVPSFFSTDDSGALVFGNRERSRVARYIPFKNAQQLRNMTRCLVHRKVSKINYAGQLGAGDLINVAGGDPLCVITAAHVFETGTDSGGVSNTYTRLWLGSLEG